MQFGSRAPGAIFVHRVFRRDLGDLTDLAESIQKVGILQPLVIDPSDRLVAGFRRLKTAEQLGLAEVPVVVVDSLEDAELALVAQGDENECRKPMTTFEKVELGRALEEVQRAAAQRRIREALDKGRREKPLENEEKTGSGKFPEPNGDGADEEEKGQVRDRVGAAIGLSGRTYEKARQVIEAAEAEPEANGDLARTIEQTDKVHAAYAELQRRRQLRLDESAKDAAGQEIPERLRESFAVKAKAKIWSKKLSALMQELKELTELPGGERIPVLAMRSKADDMRSSLGNNLPHAVCPHCHGEGCPGEQSACRNTGWLVRLTWNNIPDGQKRVAT